MSGAEMPVLHFRAPFVYCVQSCPGERQEHHQGHAQQGRRQLIFEEQVAPEELLP
jgi:hypothetical protein